MSFYLGLNRRLGGDRRVLDSGGDYTRRADDRRRCGSDSYVLVMGPVGIDRFGLMVGLPVALLLATVVIGAFVRT